jgi:hypothetical protein
MFALSNKKSIKMDSNTKLILKILYVLAWIIFVGLCIQAGGFIFNSFFTMLLNPVGAKRFWQEVDLSALYYFDRWYFLIETSLMSTVAILKATIFYLIIKILHTKNLSMTKPFSNEVGRFLFRISYLSLMTGIFCISGNSYAKWFTKHGVQMPDIQDMSMGGADVWLFMGVALYVIAQVFKRGIEIQSEQELTV